MKKILFVALAALTLAACGKDDNPKGPEGPAIEITDGQKEQTVYADETTGESSVKIETTGAWTSTITDGSATRAAATWVTIDPSSGSAAGNYTIAIKLAPNYTGTDRTATITIVCGGDKITITVTQDALTEEGEEPVEEEVPVTGVTLDQPTLTLVANDTAMLKAAIAPENATNQEVVWSSSDGAVATVDQAGKVTAVAPGTATITATSAGDAEIKAECAVTVEAEAPVDKMRYVSRVDVNDDGDLYSTVVEYDAQNRVSATRNQDGELKTSISYGDTVTTVTMVNYDEGEMDGIFVFKLNEDGAIVSGESYSVGTAAYTDGYLDKFLFGGDETFTMNWSGGDKIGWVHAEEGLLPTTYALTYNASWPNNPLCNFDLNGLIVTFDDGIFIGAPETLDMFGKRSAHMIGGYNKGNGWVYTTEAEYDTDGFITKITVLADAPEDGSGEDYTTVYTITYR